MSNRHDLFSSPTNPDGLLEHFSNGRIGEIVPEPRDRVAAAAADIYSFIHNVAEVDIDMAEVITNRAVRELVHSLDIPISDETITELVKEGITVSNDEMVNRTIEMSNDQLK